MRFYRALEYYQLHVYSNPLCKNHIKIVKISKIIIRPFFPRFAAMNTPELTFGQVNELGLGVGEKPDYFLCKGAVAYARKENCLYKACPSADCNKKVTEGSGGEYYCEKCNRTYPDFKYRMILTVSGHF